MPIIEPIDGPSVPRPETASSVSCPHCGYANKVSSYQALAGFKCSKCGQKVNGVTGGKPSPDDPCPIKEIVCPKCKNGDKLEFLPANESGKHFRCKACGTEF